MCNASMSLNLALQTLSHQLQARLNRITDTVL